MGTRRDVLATSTGQTTSEGAKAANTSSFWISGREKSAGPAEIWKADTRMSRILTAENLEASKSDAARSFFKLRAA
jgi:hypothetical protein